MEPSKPKQPWMGRLLALLVLLALTGAASSYLSSKVNQGINRSLTLPDGSKITVAAVTYGTNHIFGGALARLAQHSPLLMRGILVQLVSQFAAPVQTINTPTPTLIVWMNARSLSSFPSGSYELAFGNTNGFVSGPRNYLPISPGFQWPIQFSAFPRRERTLVLHVYQYDTKGNASECGVMEIANPCYRQYPQWQPETLPVARKAGDVEVTLKDFVTGLGGTGMSFAYNADGGFSVDLGTNKNDGRGGSACVIHLQSLSDINQVWEVNKIELGDATGNVLPITGRSGTGSEIDFMSFEPALWPGEAAWKLRCEIKCVKGFAPGELITISNVALGDLFETNHPGWQTNLNGTTISFDNLVHRPPSGSNSWNSSQISSASFKFSGMTNDLHFELVEARLEDGTKLESVSMSSTADGNGIEIQKNYSFVKVPTNAQTLSFTCALRKGLWVEFMVKPRIGSGHFEFPAAPKKK